MAWTEDDRRGLKRSEEAWKDHAEDCPTCTQFIVYHERSGMVPSCLTGANRFRDVWARRRAGLLPARKARAGKGGAT